MAKLRDESKMAIFIESIRAEKKEQLVYVDEAGIDTYLYRERARAPRGQKNIGCISDENSLGNRWLQQNAEMISWHRSDTMELAIESCLIFG